MCSGIRQNTFFFKSAGNVILQIKNPRLMLEYMALIFLINIHREPDYDSFYILAQTILSFFHHKSLKRVIHQKFLT